MAICQTRDFFQFIVVIIKCFTIKLIMIYGAKTNSNLIFVYHPLKSIEWFSSYASFGHLFSSCYSESTIHKLRSCTKKDNIFASEALLLVNPMVFVHFHWLLMCYPSMLTKFILSQNLFWRETQIFWGLNFPFWK